MQAPWSIGTHRHSDYHELYLVVRGEMDSHLPTGTAHGREGDWLIVPRQTTHRNVVNTGRLELAMIRWRGGEGLVCDPPTSYRYDTGGRLRYLFEWMTEVRDADDDGAMDRLDAILAALLHEVARLAHAAPSPLVEQVRRYVRRHLGEPIRLESLAEDASLSKYHFLRKFRAQAGVTPMRLVTQMRLEAARNLIRHSHLSLEAIAEQVGFAGEPHMHQVFRRHLGQTPGSFRPDSRT
jgi:AraC-like DNA-binding protein